jgi:hypothetical protein
LISIISLQSDLPHHENMSTVFRLLLLAMFALSGAWLSAPAAHAHSDTGLEIGATEAGVEARADPLAVSRLCIGIPGCSSPCCSGPACQFSTGCCSAWLSSGRGAVGALAAMDYEIEPTAPGAGISPNPPKKPPRRAA